MWLQIGFDSVYGSAQHWLGFGSVGTKPAVKARLHPIWLLEGTASEWVPLLDAMRCSGCSHVPKICLPAEWRSETS